MLQDALLKLRLARLCRHSLGRICFPLWDRGEESLAAGCDSVGLPKGAPI